jgi:hypothetical protein
MTTQAEYDAGTAAALEVAQADVAQEVPELFRGDIPAGAIERFAADAAKAAIDAAAQVRIKTGVQAT